MKHAPILAETPLATIADYMEAGRREFDDCGYKNDGSPWRPSDREEYSRAYVLLNMPRAARLAEIKSRNAAFDAAQATEIPSKSQQIGQAA